MNNISLEDFFRAYFDCRQNKRNSLSALEFEIDFEKKLMELEREVNDGNYKISPSNVFITSRPVKREIFAAQFRDRVIHHLIVNKLNEFFEKEFIYDSYSCRKDKGTLFGIKRIEHFIRSCSNNYQKDCWILKIDIRGYFMSINKDILIEKLVNFIDKKYKKSDKERIIWLCSKIINNDSTENCILKSPYYKWKDLPKSKSLFHSSSRCGLPIGNYTSQIFANFYLNFFDHFVKNRLNIKYYGRYVDDAVFILENKGDLRFIMPKIKKFLEEELELKIHPRKIYFQHYSKGVEFLGSFIKPWRVYVSKRVKGNFWRKLKYLNNHLLDKGLNKEKKEHIVSVVNSYLGILSHFKTYKLRRKFLDCFNNNFWNYFKIGDNFKKINFKN